MRFKSQSLSSFPAFLELYPVLGAGDGVFFLNAVNLCPLCVPRPGCQSVEFAFDQP